MITSTSPGEHSGRKRETARNDTKMIVSMYTASPGEHFGRKIDSKRVREREVDRQEIYREERGKQTERESSVSVCLSPHLSLSVPLSVYLSVSVSLPPSLSHPVYLSLFHSPSVCLSLSLLILLKRNEFCHMHLLFYVTILLFRGKDGRRISISLLSSFSSLNILLSLLSTQYFLDE